MPQLNGVIGVAGFLEDIELGPTQGDYVRLIRQSGDHLLDLLNDILDFSRLEAGRVELESVDFEPRALIRDTRRPCGGRDNAHFAEDSQALLGTMKLAAAGYDSATIYRMAHSVAGAARNVGADALGERASRLEEAAGSLSATQIAAEIAAMPAGLDAVLDRLGIRAGVTA